MNILIIGGAGVVGTIIRPALEAHHQCYYYDLKPVPGVPAGEGRSFVASVLDDYTLRHAMAGMEAVVNLSMGVRPGTRNDVSDAEAAFGVNVRGGYAVLRAAMAAGVRRFVYASSLSVYEKLAARSDVLDESVPPDGWSVYSITKRMGEFLCAAAAQRHPDAGIVALRLMQPLSEIDFAAFAPPPEVRWFPLGPRDTRRLFLAALERTATPGFLAVQASGDTRNHVFSNALATERLGWSPRGE